MSVQHRDVGAQAEPVRDAMDAEVPIGVALIVTDLPADTLGEDLGSAARQ